MQCILVFDNLNDIIYKKCNEQFSKHISNLAKDRGFISKNRTECDMDSNIFIQIFSPLVTSQRIMMNHFSNAYSSIKCFDGLCFLFDEYMGYLFMSIGNEENFWLKRQLDIFIASVKQICGPNVAMLKSCKTKNQLITALIDKWLSLIQTEQSLLVEALEQLRVDSNISITCMKALTDFGEIAKSHLPYTQIHALILVNNGFLSLYSTRGTSDLHTRDILCLSMIAQVIEEGVLYHDFDFELHTKDIEIESDLHSYNLYKPTNSLDKIEEYSIELVLLLSKNRPCAVHISYIAPGIPIYLIYEIGPEPLNLCILDTIHSLQSLQNLQSKGTTDRAIIQSVIDEVDSMFKKTGEAFKKKNVSGINKLHSNTIKLITKKWEPVLKRFKDFLKSQNLETMLSVDATIESIMIQLRCMYSNCMMDESIVRRNKDLIKNMLFDVRKNLSNIIEPLRVQANLNLNNTTYLEEFPGMVHFIYVDRVTHRFVTPKLDFSSNETVKLTKKKIWSMVEFSQKHLTKGHTYLMWKDTVFHYSYFLWFEDASGTPLKPKVSINTVIKSLLINPGILTGDFYHQLTKKCFPTHSSQRIHCYELYGIHLGLVTASSILEQSRRLTATIWEVTGVAPNPLDLF